jgi:hypothetical protein
VLLVGGEPVHVQDGSRRPFYQHAPAVAPLQERNREVGPGRDLPGRKSRNDLAATAEAKGKAVACYLAYRREFQAFFRALQSIVAGRRDRTLADALDLTYDIAAENLFLLETLETYRIPATALFASVEPCSRPIEFHCRYDLGWEARCAGTFWNCYYSGSGTPLTRTSGLQVYVATTDRLPQRLNPPSTPTGRILGVM